MFDVILFLSASRRLPFGNACVHNWHIELSRVHFSLRDNGYQGQPLCERGGKTRRAHCLQCSFWDIFSRMHFDMFEIGRDYSIRIEIGDSLRECAGSLLLVSGRMGLYERELGG